MKRYATEQRQRLLTFLEQHRDRQFSVEELSLHLCGKKAMSISAIYRNINRMVAEGSVGRFSARMGSGFIYQYIGGDCREHLHLKCESCGQLFHLDNDAVQQILLAAQRDIDFNIDKTKTILYGSCRKCS